MTTEYLHGVEIITQSQKPIIDSINESIIGVVGFIEKKDPSSSIAIDYNKLYQVNSLEEFDEEFSIKDYKSTGIRETLSDIYSQTNAQVIFSIIKKDLNKNELKNAFIRLQQAKAQLKLTPKIIISPEIGEYYSSIIDAAVLSDILLTVEKLKAILIWDVNEIDSKNLIKNYKNLLVHHNRLYPVYPKIKITVKDLDESNLATPSINKYKNEEKFKMRPASSFVAGLIVRSDKERGFWHSPSNYPLINIEGLSENIDFSLGEINCTANQLNKIKINTIIWQDGYRLWGNKSYSNSNDGFSFISVRRIADILNESIINAHLWAIDQNITKNFKETIVDSVNTYMRKLKMQGAIIDGKCYTDKNKNTTENLAEGRFYFCFEFTPPYPAERITFQSILTNDYLTEVL